MCWCVAWCVPRYFQWAPEKILNPNFVLSQKVVPRVAISNHKSPSKIFSILFFISFLLYHIYGKVESTMIDKEYVFGEFGTGTCMWCGSETQGADLAQMCQVAIDNKVSLMSVVPDAVPVVWPWLEHSKITINARFYLENKKFDEMAASDLAKRVIAVFKNGADGATVFIRNKDLADFVSAMNVVRDDLFFNKDLTVGLDIMEFGAYDWANVFELLKKINVNSVAFFMGTDTGKKSDFVGRVYGMLDAWPRDFNAGLCWAFGNNVPRFDQAKRLVDSLRSDLADVQKFFVNF